MKFPKVDTANAVLISELGRKLPDKVYVLSFQIIQSSPISALKEGHMYQLGLSFSIRDSSGEHKLTLYGGLDIPNDVREQIWELYAANMKELAEHSSFGWDRSEKETEWFHPHSRILTIVDTSAALTGSKTRGKVQSVLFACGLFRFDTEQNEDDKMDEVLYCYELQVSNKAQRQGLGRKLLDLIEEFGSQYGMKKVMLTCLKENAVALSFYSKRGYTNDPICPSNWTESDNEDEDEDDEDENEENDEKDEEDEKADYFILSKSL